MTEAADFYTRISPYYDSLFPLRTQKVDFIAGVLTTSGPGRILELACGTGRLALALAARGFRVVALDESEALLAGALGRQRGEGGAMGVAARMEALPLGGAGIFDAVLCLGNSLPHLSLEAMAALFGECAEMLTTGGVFLFQMMDFDWVERCGGVELPPLSHREPEGERVKLTRRYYVTEVGAFFEPTLSVAGMEFSYRIAMTPVGLEEAKRMATDAGFSWEGTYGDFAGGPYRREGAYIAIACKR